MNFRDYYSKIESLLKELPLITHFSVDFEEITDFIGYIKGKLELIIVQYFTFLNLLRFKTTSLC
jgi:cell fate (sporulation/competence/biofilm development) regulator YmcA (YheA/YmcA/DUF963 family)